MSSKLSLNVGFVAIVIGASACGGGQKQPAESAAPASTESAPAAESKTSATPSEQGSSSMGGGDAGAGEHTMPDGTKMPGHHHEGM